MTPEEIYEQTRIADGIVAEKRRIDMETNLPSWAQVSTACDNISNLAEAKAFIKKLARVVYWLAKSSEV